MLDLNFHLGPLIPVPDRANAAIACLNDTCHFYHELHPIRVSEEAGILGYWVESQTITILFISVRKIINSTQYP